MGRGSERHLGPLPHFSGLGEVAIRLQQADRDAAARSQVERYMDEFGVDEATAAAMVRNDPG